MILCSFTIKSQVVYNPEFVIKTLQTQRDTTAYNQFTNQVFLEKAKTSVLQIESIKQNKLSIIPFVVILIILIVIILSRLLWKDYISYIAQSIFSTKNYLLYFNLHRFDNVPVIIISILLEIGFVLLLYTMFLYFNGIHLKDFNFTTILIIVLAFVVVRNIIEILFNWASDSLKQYYRFFYFNQFHTILILSLLSLIALIGYYHPNIIQLKNVNYIGVVLLSVITIIVIIQNIMLANKISNVNFLYFFMYICTFKLLPLALIVKTVITYL
ncbi:MAG: DUF4271 domain-containing protein [Chitinophagales bacterium]|nr:DUF4271 domain-containing protein [Chitinophagales bacterium]